MDESIRWEGEPVVRCVQVSLCEKYDIIAQKAQCRVTRDTESKVLSSGNLKPVEEPGFNFINASYQQNVAGKA